jgi:3-oxoacyl-[acyl-carrier protein] reductase
MSDRVALLLGASTGIGHAVAEILAREGDTRIVLASRNPAEAARRLADAHGAQVTPVTCDVADPGGTRACVDAVRQLGRLDALLLNHGGPPVGPVMDFGDDDWRRWFEPMVVGPLRMLRECVPFMRAAGGGRVVAISSFTVKAPYQGVALSNALRAALVNALKTVAIELGGDGILVNGVGPGYTATERVTSFNEAQAQRRGITVEAVDAEVKAQIPLGRYGEPEDVAEVVAFLLSERNRYVTGQHLLADGGLVVAT